MKGHYRLSWPTQTFSWLPSYQGSSLGDIWELTSCRPIGFLRVKHALKLPGCGRSSLRHVGSSLRRITFPIHSQRQIGCRSVRMSLTPTAGRTTPLLGDRSEPFCPCSLTPHKPRRHPWTSCQQTTHAIVSSWDDSPLPVCCKLSLFLPR